MILAKQLRLHSIDFAPDYNFRLKSEMALVVDSRERDLVEVLRRLAISHSVETLPVGDVMGEAWIAERKTANDLARSITTGRWSKQQYRLFATGRSVY